MGLPNVESCAAGTSTSPTYLDVIEDSDEELDLPLTQILEECIDEELRAEEEKERQLRSHAMAEEISMEFTLPDASEASAMNLEGPAAGAAAACGSVDAGVAAGSCASESEAKTPARTNDATETDSTSSSRARPQPSQGQWLLRRTRRVTLQAEEAQTPQGKGRPQLDAVSGSKRPHPDTAAPRKEDLAKLPWEKLWPQLQAQGWSMEFGPRGSGQQAYYFPPGVKRGPGTKNRIDYFDSKKLVMQLVGAGRSKAAAEGLAKRLCQRPGEAPAMTVRSRGGEQGVPRPLEGWTVVVTGFGMEEAQELQDLAISLGAFVSSFASRLPGTTAGLAVLASSEATSLKVLMSLALGVPPVKRSWLDEVAQKSTPVSAEPHALVLTGALAPARGWDRALQPLPQGIFGRLQAPPVTIHLAGSELFYARWAQLVQTAGAQIVGRIDGGCRYVLVEHGPLRLTPLAVASLRRSGTRTVQAEWLKASLVAQREASGFDVELLVDA